MAKNKDNSLYYNSDKLVTYNKWLNFIISNRGGGKTYHFVKKGIKNYIKNCSQFIYLRRHETELETRNSFFNWIIKNEEFPEYDFKINGFIGFIKKKNEKKWNILCYFLPLSTAGTKFKGGSYPLVTMIIYDEFIIRESGNVRYLKNEPFLLMEFYSTVDRDEDRVTIYALGNAISFVNPFFIYFNIFINPCKNFNLSEDKTVIVETYTNNELIEIKKNTRFGKTSQNTEYGAYSINNEALLDTNDFIISRPSANLKFLCSMEIYGREIGFWDNEDENYIFVDFKINNTSKERYVLAHEDHKPDYKMIALLKNKFISYKIKVYSDKAQMFFLDNEVKRLVYYCLKYI